MNLKDLFEAVKEEKLPKEKLESYYDQLIHLHTAMHLQLAEIEKAEAIFFLDAKGDNGSETDVSIKRKWRASEKGLRMIELNRFIKATAKEVESLKSRIFRLL